MPRRQRVFHRGIVVNPTSIITDLLARGHAVQFQARGDSMHPLIRENDYLHVEPCARLRVGDVVLVLAERGLTAHRVIVRRARTVITRGDNTPAADAAVAEDRVLGKVTHVLRNGVKKGVGRIGLIGRMRRIGRRFVL
jgi:signal peptidase I